MPLFQCIEPKTKKVEHIMIYKKIDLTGAWICLITNLQDNGIRKWIVLSCIGVLVEEWHEDNWGLWE